MGGSSSKPPVVIDGPTTKKWVTSLPPELRKVAQVAKERLEKDEGSIPCELGGVDELHSNFSGPLRGFASVGNRRSWLSAKAEALKALDGHILEHWQELDVDFTLNYADAASVTLPHYRKLQAKVWAELAAQTKKYQGETASLDKYDLKDIARMDAVWPTGLTARELKERCVQPEDASTLRLTYAWGLRRLELLYIFTEALKRFVNSQHRVEWDVKRPLRLLSKNRMKYPEEASRDDFRQIADVVRTTLVVDRLSQLIRLLKLLVLLGRESKNKTELLTELGIFQPDLHDPHLKRIEGDNAQKPRPPMGWPCFVVERIKNRFAIPAMGGYRDIQVNLRINGYVTEIQIHLEQLHLLKGVQARNTYKWFSRFSQESDEYEGGRADDGTMHGLGKHRLLGGGYYVGEFHFGRRDGHGKLYYPSGDWYVGDFLNGRMHGQGVYHFTNGDRYKGSFQNDQMHGQGTYYNADGSRYVGGYISGMKHGGGVAYNAAGVATPVEHFEGKPIVVEHKAIARI